MCIRDRAGGGFGQTDSQPVQPVRVQSRQCADSVRFGRGQLRKGVKQLAAQSEVCKLERSILLSLIHI